MEVVKVILPSVSLYTIVYMLLFSLHLEKYQFSAIALNWRSENGELKHES